MSATTIGTRARHADGSPMNRLKLVALLLGLTLGGFTQAQEVKVAAGIFIGVIDKDGQGPYQLILKEAAKRAGIPMAERIYPLKRAVKVFTQREALAIYGMTEAVIAEIGTQQIITSYPLGAYKLYIFTRKGDPPISSYAQLKGKTVGGVIGYEAYYRELLKRHIDIQYIADEDSQIKKLELRRIDAVIGFMPDWIPLSDTLVYDPKFPVHTGYDYMTVWNTPEGQAFVAKLSPALQGMKHDGTLQRLLGGRWMDFNYRAQQQYEWAPPK